MNILKNILCKMDVHDMVDIGKGKAVCTRCKRIATHIHVPGDIVCPDWYTFDEQKPVDIMSLPGWYVEEMTEAGETLWQPKK